MHDDVTEYGSIGAFYDAVEYGASLLKSDAEGGTRQIDHFGAFYRWLPTLTVAQSGEHGYREAALLIEVIRDQGEGSDPNGTIRPVFQNTADDGTAGKDHYAKFIGIREAPLPATYPVKSPSTHTEHDEALLKALVVSFDELRAAMASMFAGGSPNDFLPVMIKVGAGTQTCWKNGLVPRFS